MGAKGTSNHLFKEVLVVVISDGLLRDLTLSHSLSSINLDVSQMDTCFRLSLKFIETHKHSGVSLRGPARQEQCQFYACVVTCGVGQLRNQSLTSLLHFWQNLHQVFDSMCCKFLACRHLTGENSTRIWLQSRDYWKLFCGLSIYPGKWTQENKLSQIYLEEYSLETLIHHTGPV